MVQRQSTRRRWTWILVALALFILSAVAAGAAVAFLPDWTALVVVLASGYALWLIGEQARRT